VSTLAEKWTQDVLSDPLSDPLSHEAELAAWDAELRRQVASEETEAERDATLTKMLVADYDPRSVSPTRIEEIARAAHLAEQAAAPRTLLEIAAAKMRALQAIEAARLAKFAPLIQVSASKKVEVGTEWWYEPSLAGHEGYWQPDIVRVVEMVTAPMPRSNPNYPPPPVRQYVVRLPGGTHLFANDASLFYINLARTGPRDA
jgi:hypothetical protein